MVTWLSINNYSNTRECLLRFPNTENRVENTTRSGVFLTNFEVFGDRSHLEETLSRGFDISSQSKLKLRRKRRDKILKCYANKKHISKHRDGSDFLRFSPFALIRDFRSQNTRRNLSKISVSLACYRQIGSKSTSRRHSHWCDLLTFFTSC